MTVILLGCVGDWLATPSIEGAWLSGQELGKHLGDEPLVGAGLVGRFVPAGDSSGIGDIEGEVVRQGSGAGTRGGRGRGGFSRVQGRGGGAGPGFNKQNKTLTEMYGSQRRSLGPT